ncbi:MAG: SIS domain-containing protein, partial [Candidatus Krumholzibacteria bacterium]|nr:SIS domain-containing protein [Candidatus Krumholzibacteria bacterium]
SIVTAVSNDFGYAEVFSRQLEGLAGPGDCLVAISTSGNSQNVINACQVARRMSMKIFTLTGENKGPLSDQSDVALRVPDSDTARIQEIHLIALHLLCQMVEESLFSPATTRSER